MEKNVYFINLNQLLILKQLLERIQTWTEEGNIDEITNLLSQHKLKKIDLNIQNSTGYTPLSLAVKYGNIELVKLYLLIGCDANLTNHSKQSPLFLACWFNHVQIAKILIEYGANLNQPDQRGLTPLMISCQHEHKNIIKLLLESQADITIQDCFGKTCLDRVRQQEIKKMFEHYLLESNTKKIENNEYFYEKRARSASTRLIEKYKQKIQSGDSGKKSCDYLESIISSKKKLNNVKLLQKIQQSQTNCLNYLTTNQNQLTTENEIEEKENNSKYFSTKQRSNSCAEQQEQQQQEQQSNYLLQQVFIKNNKNDKKWNTNNNTNNSTIKTQKIDQLKQLIFEKYYPNYTSVQENLENQQQSQQSQQQQQIPLVSKQKKDESQLQKNENKASFVNQKDERLTKTEIKDLITNQFNELSEKFFCNLSSKISSQIETSLTFKEKLLTQKIKQKMQQQKKNSQNVEQENNCIKKYESNQSKNHQENYLYQQDNISNSNLISLERTSLHTNFKKPTIAINQLNDIDIVNSKHSENTKENLKQTIQNEMQCIYEKLETSLKVFIKKEVETQYSMMNEKIMNHLLENKGQSQSQIDQVLSNKALSTKNLLQQNNNILNFCKLNSNTNSKLKKSQNDSQTQLMSNSTFETKPKFEDIKTVFNISHNGNKRSYDSNIGPLIVSQFLVDNQQNYKLRQTNNKTKNSSHSKIQQTNENLVHQTKFN